MFCAIDDDEAQHREAGGRAIASYFLGDAPNEQDRAFLTLAWESAFRRRNERDEEIDLGAPVTEDDADAVPMPSWLANRQAGKIFGGAESSPSLSASRPSRGNS